MLLPLDDGTYQDRRNGKKLDTRKTIWIFATNHAERIIADFAEDHGSLGDNFTKKAPFGKLKQDLRNSFKIQMGAPFTGRINAIVPFFPFTEDEQAVVAHSFLLAELRKCRRPIDLAQDKLIGDLHISTTDDGKLCSLLAERHYDPDLGARSLAQAVTDDIMIPLVELYLEPPGNEGLGRGPRADVALEKYAMHVGSSKTEEGDEEQGIVMKRDGETKLKSVDHKVDEDLFSALESWKLVEQGTFTMMEDLIT